jgi:hypothetical protein
MLHVEILEYNGDKIRKLASEAGTSYNSMANIIIDIALREVDVSFFTKHISAAIHKTITKTVSKQHLQKSQTSGVGST